MAIEQDFIFTDNTAQVSTLNRVEVDLNGGGVNLQYDSDIDTTELSYSLNGNGTYTIRLRTLEGNSNTTGIITLYFTLNTLFDGQPEECIKTVAFTPVVFDCPPSALSGSEEYLIFITDGEEVNGKYVIDGVESCAIVINTI